MVDIFKDAPFEIDDLFLLEEFQIACLPGYIAERECAVVLHAYPAVGTFLRKKHPPIARLIDRIISEHGAARD